MVEAVVTETRMQRDHRGFIMDIIKVMWDNEAHTAIRYALTGTWDWTQLRAANQKGAALITMAPHKVDVIVDMTAADKSRAGLIKEALCFLPQLQENLGAVVVVGGGDAVRASFKTVYPLFRDAGYTMMRADTLTQARTLLVLARLVSTRGRTGPLNAHDGLRITTRS